MTEEDDVDIVGVLNDDIVQPGGAYSVDDMGLNDLLPLLGSHNWLLSTDQVRNLENSVEEKNRFPVDNGVLEREIKITVPSSKPKATNLVAASHKKPWTEPEKCQFVKGLGIYGKSWSKISKFIGTRTTLQVKNFARQYLKNQDQQLQTNRGSQATGGKTNDDHVNGSEGSDVTNKTSTTETTKSTPNQTFMSSSATELEFGIEQPDDGQIVRIHKANEDSESEDIDIEDVSDGEDRMVPSLDRPMIKLESVKSVSAELNVKRAEISSSVVRTENEFITASSHPFEEAMCDTGTAPNSTTDVVECHIFHLDIPLEERLVVRAEISDEERAVHREFFEGRSSQKTPERYLRIRNHILDAWESRRRRGDYLNKTCVRQGLRNCGDVNCIGRIHGYLEQTGAINFGCAQTVYVRPFSLPARQQVSSSSKKIGGGYSAHVDTLSLYNDLTWRSRKRKVPILRYDSVAGGFTLEHGVDGEVIDVTKGVEAPPAPTKRVKRRENPFRLIKCAEYSENRRPPFSVSVSLDALLVMDIHAHLSSLEVIGLLGGHFYPESAELQVLTAEPCTSLSTGSECEMDPVSQTVASERLQRAGQSVIGWYHSHPTFAPNPSVRDIETQTKFQEWFGAGGAPFLGAIISPDLTSFPFSKIRYLVVGDESGGAADHPGESFRSPYRLPTVVSPFEGDVAELVAKSKFVVELSTSSGSKAPLNLLNKLLSSIHHHAGQAQVDQDSAMALMGEIGRMLITLAVKEPEI